MKVIVVGGYPGSGKSTIVRILLGELEKAGHKFKTNKKGIITWMESDKMIILGSYAPEEMFPGTDRLPLNAQPEAQKFILSRIPITDDKVIFFEGDRLFNDKMLKFLEEHFEEVILCIVSVEQDLLQERRNSRSEQNETWRKGRETKVNRIAMTHPVHHHLLNNTRKEQEKSVLELLAEVNGEWKSKPVTSKISSLWR